MKKNNKLYALHTWLVAVLVLSITVKAKPPTGLSEAAIIGSVSTGEEPVPTPEVPQPVFNIKNTQHRNVKGRSITIHEVVAPQAQVKQARRNTPQPEAQTDVFLDGKQPEIITTHVLFISGVVYGKLGDQLAKLRVWCDGRECEIITNIDFKYFSGFGGFHVKDRAYMCLPSVVSAIDSKGRAIQSLPEDLRNVRQLAKNGTANRYAIVKMDTEAPLSHQVLDDIITLYEQEKDHLKAAYETRKANCKIRAAKLAAEEPPPPKPVTIHFWKRDIEQEQEQARAQQAAQKGEPKS